MKDGISHDQLLNGQRLYKIFEEIIGTEPMEPETINSAGTHFFQSFQVIFCRQTCADKVVI